MIKHHSYDTIPLKAAKAEGYKPLTYPYKPQEYSLMDRVIRDMKRGPIDYVLVTESENLNDISVFRKTNSG